jgi:hypothetical protein
MRGKLWSARAAGTKTSNMRSLIIWHMTNTSPSTTTMWSDCLGPCNLRKTLVEWTREWFCVKADTKKREEFQDIVMSPLRISFGYKKTFVQNGLRFSFASNPCCFSYRGGPHWDLRDLVQELIANQTFPTLSGWRMPKPKKGDEEGNGVLKVLLYQFKEHPLFKGPCIN